MIRLLIEDKTVWIDQIESHSNCKQLVKDLCHFVEEVGTYFDTQTNSGMSTKESIYMQRDGEDDSWWGGGR